MILNALGLFKAAISAIPWQLRVAIAILLTFALTALYFDAQGYKRGRADVMAALLKAEADAAKRNETARVIASDAKNKRQGEFEGQQDELRGIIDSAGQTGDNPLDSLVGEM